MDTNNTTGDINKYIIPISIVLAAVIIGGAVYFGSGKGTGTTTQNTPKPVAVNIKDISIDGAPFIGNANAPVTIAYWSDYQCPFCKQFDETTMTQIIDTYVNQGKVKIVFMDFQFLGPDSIQDAIFARAVWELYPEKFAEWHAAFFATQPTENSLSAADNQANLMKVTATVSGIDAKKVADLAVQKKATYQAAIDKDKSEGQKVGVTATPSFVIGTNLIVGAESFAQFQADIDPLLK